jgi:ABC-type bacteriocin/lantibiotic exporter with double-glycine peptidase domain
MIEWFAQEHPASCVAACLRMVFSSFGTLFTEAEIRQMLGNPRYGLTLRDARDKLLESGALAEWHSDWGSDDLRDCVRDGSFPIVGVERRFFGHPSAAHAVVVVSVRAGEIEFLDPLQTAAPCLTSFETFVAAWRHAGQEVLLLATPPSA